jgi:hypothetical protein
MTWISVNDFDSRTGWKKGVDVSERARWYCEQLERGEIIFFPHSPFPLPATEQEFLLSQKQAGSRFHKNVSYRPTTDVLRGYAARASHDVDQLHRVMRRFSMQVTDFLTRFAAPYAGHWQVDFASFRPQEEKGRDLPLRKRNDLLHVDAFPSRPTHGGRILRVFTNINPDQPRVWITTDRFRELAAKHAQAAGLGRFAAEAATPRRTMLRTLRKMKRTVGLRAPDYSLYDEFMLHFHDYLKENAAFQRECIKTRYEFPPQSSWMVYTDTVSHAVLSGRYALEQTYIISREAMVVPQLAPISILESLCGQSLLNDTPLRRAA